MKISSLFTGFVQSCVRTKSYCCAHSGSTSLSYTATKSRKYVESRTKNRTSSYCSCYGWKWHPVIGLYNLERGCL